MLFACGCSIKAVSTAGLQWHIIILIDWQVDHAALKGLLQFGSWNFFVKKKPQVFKSYEEINFCKNGVMRKQTLEQAFFLKGEFHHVSAATRNSDAWEIAGVCWKTKLNLSSYLSIAKWEKEIWERHCMFIRTFINLPLETHLIWWTIRMIFVKTLICFV